MKVYIKLKNKIDILFLISSIILFSPFILLILLGFIVACFALLIYASAALFPTIYTNIYPIFEAIEPLLFVMVIGIISFSFIFVNIAYVTNFVILFIKLFSKNKTKKDYIILISNIALLILFIPILFALMFLFFISPMI